MIVFLDTNTLGLLTNPNELPEALSCEQWIYTCYCRGVSIVTSSICDYEVRRGLIASSLRLNQVSQSVLRLNKLRTEGLISFLPVQDSILDRGAELWAQSSVKAITNKEVKNIDVDIIISAQCQILESENPGRRVIIATTNVDDLSVYCEAANWQDIKPP